MYEQLLASEVEILADAEQLLELAMAGNSHQFNALRDRYLQRIEQLRMLRTAVDVTDEQREVLLEIALSLLRFDARIRRIVEPELDQPDQWLARAKIAEPGKLSKIKPVGA